MYDVVIIGGGPAGITAGIYCARKNLKTLLITKDFIGQAGKASIVENWPGTKKISGPELMSEFRAHIDSLGLEILDGDVVSGLEKEGETFKVRTIKGEEFESITVIITSGRNPRPLKVKGEKEYLGKGVSYCAICDGPLFFGKSVVIIGGGNAGFETALEMAEKKSPKIYILEMAPRVPADEILQEKAKELKKIEVFTRATLKEIKGEQFVKSIIFDDKESKEERELEVEGVFVEIGSVPVTDFIKDLADFNEKGEIIIHHRSCSTRTPGLFAAGDVTDVPYKQIVIAAGEGAKAALAAYNHIQNFKNGQDKIN